MIVGADGVEFSSVTRAADIYWSLIRTHVHLLEGPRCAGESPMVRAFVANSRRHNQAQNSIVSTGIALCIGATLCRQG